MKKEQYDAIAKQFDDALWFDGIYLAGFSTHCNWEIICKFSGLYRDVHGNYSFDIDESVCPSVTVCSRIFEFGFAAAGSVRCFPGLGPGKIEIRRVVPIMSTTPTIIPVFKSLRMFPSQLPLSYLRN